MLRAGWKVIRWNVTLCYLAQVKHAAMVLTCGTGSPAGIKTIQENTLKHETLGTQQKT